MKSKLNSGLIKEAILLSIALFALVQFGVEIDELFTAEFWQDIIEKLRTVIEFAIYELKRLFWQ